MFLCEENKKKKNSYPSYLELVSHCISQYNIRNEKDFCYKGRFLQ